MRELSGVLRELQQHRVSPAGLREIAALRGQRDPLALKLLDLALLLESYQDWLRERGLWDAGHQLELAAEALAGLRSLGGKEPPTLAGEIWLDGFAELTPQELWILLALVPHTPRMTLTFCLESDLPADPGWLSVWSPIAQLYRRCLTAFSACPEATVCMRTLSRRPEAGRFSSNPILAHLERHWADGEPWNGQPGTRPGEGLGQMDLGLDQEAERSSMEETITLWECANPEAEAIQACREIRRFARAGGRYRDAAILLRRLEGYSDLLARLLTRYEIPYFLDRREPMAHHPLAELTQYALRILAYQWRAEDLFGAWKTGFFPVREDLIDRLENEGLARGWQGDVWRRPLAVAGELEDARRELVRPFENLAAALGGGAAFSGPALAEVLSRLWEGLRVEAKLAEWDEARHRTVHGTVWREMGAWRDNLALAFSDQEFGLREWLATVETGLAGLTVGTIPPALDQVLIGAIDRSRNPDLQLAIVLGLNEGLFPLTPPSPRLLTESERDVLEDHEVRLAGNRRQFLGRERFLGYIACTRARSRLVLTYSARDAAGDSLNPSSLVARVQTLFPSVRPRHPAEQFGWGDAEHYCELLGRALREERNQGPERQVTALLNLPAMQKLRERLPVFRAVGKAERLPEELVGRVFGPELRTSVTALERFASCPFQFFVRQTLRGRERLRFELEARERGSFVHAVLAAYHESLSGEGLRWRDLAPEQARERVRQVAAAVAEEFRDGLMRSAPSTRFETGVMTRQIEEFVAMDTAWMSRYAFDPWKVEIQFGGEKAEFPAWRIELAGGRRVVLHGKIDRVDVWRDAAATRVVVIDYKAREKTLDGLMMRHGVTLQLPAYLNVLRHAAHPTVAEVLPSTAETGAAPGLWPAGMFYAPLQGERKVMKRRDESEPGEDPQEAQWKAHQFRGRFAGEFVRQFDAEARDGGRGSHFNFAIKKKGGFDSRNKDPVPQDELTALLDQNAETIRLLAERVYHGEAGLDPYQKGNKKACDGCDCHAICRVDLWTQPFRKLAGTAGTSI